MEKITLCADCKKADLQSTTYCKTYHQKDISSKNVSRKTSLATSTASASILFMSWSDEDVIVDEYA